MSFFDRNLKKDCDRQFQKLLRNYKDGSIIRYPRAFVAELDTIQDCEFFYPRMVQLRRSINFQLQHKGMGSVIADHERPIRGAFEEYVSFWDYLWL